MKTGNSTLTDDENWDEIRKLIDSCNDDNDKFNAKLKLFVCILLVVGAGLIAWGLM